MEAEQHVIGLVALDNRPAMRCQHRQKAGVVEKRRQDGKRRRALSRAKRCEHRIDRSPGAARCLLRIERQDDQALAARRQEARRGHWQWKAGHSASPAAPPSRAPAAATAPPPDPANRPEAASRASSRPCDRPRHCAAVAAARSPDSRAAPARWGGYQPPAHPPKFTQIATNRLRGWFIGRSNVDEQKTVHPGSSGKRTSYHFLPDFRESPSRLRRTPSPPTQIPCARPADVAGLAL